VYDYQFSDDAVTAWMLLRRTSYAIHRIADRHLNEMHLTAEQVHALWLCRDYRGLVTPAELSRLLFRESQTIAGLLARMERDGLVKRVPKQRGHPFTEVKITDKGEELCRAGLEKARTLIAELMSPLSTEELEQFKQLLRKLQQKAFEELRIELIPLPDYDCGEVDREH